MQHDRQRAVRAAAQPGSMADDHRPSRPHPERGRGDPPLRRPGAEPPARCEGRHRDRRRVHPRRWAGDAVLRVGRPRSRAVRRRRRRSWSTGRTRRCTWRSARAPHLCLGAPLGRLETRIVLELLTTMTPEIDLVPDQVIEYSPNASVPRPQGAVGGSRGLAYAEARLAHATRDRTGRRRGARSKSSSASSSSPRCGGLPVEGDWLRQLLLLPRTGRRSRVLLAREAADPRRVAVVVPLLGDARGRVIATRLGHQGSSPRSSKKRPEGPSAGSVASRITTAAASSGTRTPPPVMSVSV